MSIILITVAVLLAVSITVNVRQMSKVKDLDLANKALREYATAKEKAVDQLSKDKQGLATLMSQYQSKAALLTTKVAELETQLANANKPQVGVKESKPAPNKANPQSNKAAKKPASQKK